ncbi:MAG: aryl-sulfate sulfotransferase [Enterococcus sp.]
MKKSYWLIIVGLVIFSGTLYFIWNHFSKAPVAQETNVEFIPQVKASEEVATLDYRNLALKTYKDLYTQENMTAIQALIDEQKAAREYQFPEILALSNPYLTNTTGVYVYFETATPTKVRYTVETTDAQFKSFAQIPFNSTNATSGQAEAYTTQHEYQLLGAIAGEENTITLITETASGEQTEKRFTYTPPKLETTKKVSLTTKSGSSQAELSQGLYAVIGNNNQKQDATYLADNDGVIRAEIPLVGYNSTRLNLDGQGNMYLGLSEGRIAKFNSLGKMEKLYNLAEAGYLLHHDFVFDDEGNLLVLATSREADEKEKLVEDRIIKVDVNNGAVTELADFRDYFPKLYQIATGLSHEEKWDPIHLNTIQYVAKDDAVIVSSRETSTIMKVNQINTQPEIDYLISDPSVWEAVDEGYPLLEKVGDFVPQAGQHTVTYLPDANLADGQYYLYMFNNNSAFASSRADFKWDNYPDTGIYPGEEDDFSLYYNYLVDENAGTYELVDSFEVPYSPIVSSAQQYQGHLVIDSGTKGVFAEYDQENQLITEFTMELSADYLYRVYKDDFNNYYFSAE